MTKASPDLRSQRPPAAVIPSDDDPWAELLARNAALDALESGFVEGIGEDDPNPEKPGALWEIKSEADFLKLEELLAYIRSL